MISVIVCTYNRSQKLKSFLYSLEQTRAPIGMPWELIVVDNKSTDDTAQIVTAFAAQTRMRSVYIFEARQGLSHARNTGVRAAGGKIVAFTDDDVTVDAEWLRGFEETFNRYDCAGAGGKIIPVWNGPKPPWLRVGGPRGFRYGAIVSFDHGQQACELATPLVGANMAFKKSVFESYGQFRVDLGRCGTDAMIGEDTEFCLRLLHHGQRLVYAPGAVVYHPVPAKRLKYQFESHYFNCGRFDVRLSGIPEEAILWFGAPRHMWKSLSTDTWNWLSCFGAERFRRKLQACASLGAIREARRMSRAAVHVKYHRLAADKK